MVIDTHCHIIPQLDDGSESMEESLKMLRMASQEGIGAVIATPHFEYGMGFEGPVQRKKQYEKLCRCAEKSGIFVKLYQGNEIFYSDSIIESLMKGDVWTLNQTQYVLVEFPSYADFLYVQAAVRRLQYAGYWPVLAHIERYESLGKIEKIEKLVDQGAYIQVNSAAVTGKNGWGVRQYVKKLMRCNLVHFLGTDAHGSRSRKPEMEACLSYIKYRFGDSYCRMISEENPEKLIKGEQIYE